MKGAHGENNQGIGSGHAMAEPIHSTRRQPVLGLRQCLSGHRQRSQVCSAFFCKSAFLGLQKGLRFDGTNIA
jgi:hypothetical protein